MTVYVDEPVTYSTGAIKTRLSRYGNQWAHLMVGHADDLQELHDFAAKLGLKREWFQESDVHPHYDLTARRRDKAVALGAKPVSRQQLAQLCVRGAARRLIGTVAIRSSKRA